ncbi:MAG: efflux RND transporter periplasmic adaptor subunit [Pseudomonadota bacterium]
MFTKTRLSLALAAVLGAAVAGTAGVQQLSAAAPETPTAVTAPAPQVVVEQPLVKPVVEWDEYTGRFEAIDNVELRARVSGYLTEVAFTDGELVEAGDLLFRIDPRPFEAELAAAKASLASAAAVRRTAQAEAKRGELLIKRRAIAQEEAERRTRELRQAEAQWAAARAAVTQAELNLEFTAVRAPISGRVSDNFVSVGNLIVGGAQGGTLLTTLVSLDPIYFEFTASEADYLKYLRLARDGSRASGREAHHPVRVRLMDEQSFDHAGELSFVDNQLDRSTATMRGRATLANSDGLFSPGMFGRLQLIGSGEYQAVLIPDRAVQTDQSEKFVWVARQDQIAERRPVQLGPLIDGLRVVRTGLTAADQVIVSGTQFVQGGAPVAIVTPEHELHLAHR